MNEYCCNLSVLSVCTSLLNSWFHFSSASAQLHTWHIIIYSVLQQLELKISTHLVTHGLHLGTILKYVISAWGGSLCPDITCSIQFSSGPLTLAHLLDMQKCTQRGPFTQIDQQITCTHVFILITIFIFFSISLPSWPALVVFLKIIHGMIDEFGAGLP